MTGALRTHVQLLAISDQEVTLITIRRQISTGLLHFSTTYEYDTNCSLLSRMSVLEQRAGLQSAHYKRLGSPAQSAAPPVQSPVCGVSSALSPCVTLGECGFRAMEQK